MLTAKLGEALKEVKGAAPASQLPFFRMISQKISKSMNSFNPFLSVNAQQQEEEPRGEAASSESEMTIAVDLSHFAEMYESSILQLDQLTPHQEEKMGDALTLLRGGEKHIVHLTAAAGAGKTFVAQKIVLDLLKDPSRDGIILFSARSVPLCLFFVKWLVKSSEAEDEQMIKTIVERVQVLYAPYKQGPLAVKLNEEKGEIEFVGVPEGGKVQSMLLVVEDEAHHTYGDPELKLQVERQILRWAPCHRLLLSDVSQSQGTEIAYPKDRKVVELTEVVRSSKRIITAANDFSLCGTKEKVPTCHHASEGPPLQTFLFDMQQEDEPRRDELYAEQTIAALQSVVTQFERLPLHDRLAIIVPDEGMRARLQEKLKARLAAAFPSRSFELVDAQRASRTYKKGVGSSEWLVLDTIENMDGLERLMVIAVGLDSPIPENAEAARAAAEGNVLQTRSSLQTRSHLYRALTRAHMLVCVVNETLPRGWLAYLTRLKLSKGGAFDEAAAVAERKAAEESVANEKKRVTKCKEEAKAAVEAVAKKHSLGEKAVEWCSAMAAKQLMAGGAAKAAAEDAVCEWLLKAEMEKVEEKMAQERGLEAEEARAAVGRCVRSELLESIRRAPLKGGEGEKELAAVLAQWRRIGEELKNALAAQEGLEGVGATDMMRMQEAVMAVAAKGGKALKVAVVFEVQEAKRRREQMKEAAVHRAREEKLKAERKVKEEKLRTEEVQPAMAALLAGEAEEGDKVARDWICADAVERLVAGAGGSGVDGKTAVQAAVAAWRQLKAVRPKTNLVAVREEKEQSVWDTKANLSVVVGGVLAFDPTSLHLDDTNLIELRFTLHASGGQAVDPLSVVEPAALQAAIEAVLGGQHPLAAMYVNDEQAVITRIPVTDVAFLHGLRDKVLEGRFAVELTDRLRRQLSSVSLDVKVDLSAFAERYESSVLHLDKLTEHQQLKLLECKGHQSVRVEAPAGGGKTFIALHEMLGILQLESAEESENAAVLFVAPHEALAVFVASWIGTRLGKYTRDEMLHEMLRRLWVLFLPFDQGVKRASLTDEGWIFFEQPSADEKPKEFRMVVVDEGHHIYNNAALRETVESHVAPSTRRIVLADVSQSLGQDIAYPPAHRVELTEVVRCSKRIVQAASVVQIGGERKLHTQCHHRSDGPPVKSFLFELAASSSSVERFRAYAERVMAALEHIANLFPRLELTNRVAILVPDAPFLDGLKPQLMAEFQARGRRSDQTPGQQYILIEARGAAAALRWRGRSSGGEALVLDTIGNFDGLERLIVIAVGLDAPLDQESDDAFLETRSRLYRALTRAHMLAMVVNEAVRGGWLEWLNLIKLKEGKFDREAELARMNADAAEAEVKRRREAIDKALQAAIERRARAVPAADTAACAHGVAPGSLTGEEHAHVRSLIDRDVTTGGQSLEAAADAQLDSWCTQKDALERALRMQAITPSSAETSELLLGVAKQVSRAPTANLDAAVQVAIREWQMQAFGQSRSERLGLVTEQTVWDTGENSSSQPETLKFNPLQQELDDGDDIDDDGAAHPHRDASHDLMCQSP